MEKNPSTDDVNYNQYIFFRNNHEYIFEDIFELSYFYLRKTWDTNGFFFKINHVQIKLLLQYKKYYLNNTRKI